MGSMALQLRPFTVPDASDMFQRAMTLRDMMDQRRYNQLRQQGLELKMEQERDEMEQARSLQQLFRENAKPTVQQVMERAPGSLGMRYMTEMRNRETAELNARKAQADFDGLQKKIVSFKALSTLKIKDPAIREAKWGEIKPELLKYGLMTEAELDKPFDESHAWQVFEVVDPKAAQDLRNSIAEAARQEAEEKRAQGKYVEEVTIKAPLERQKLTAEVELANRRLQGNEPATGTLREFKDVYYPGYLAAKGIKNPTAKDEYNAYVEFRELLRARIGGVPGVDVPYPAPVAKQREEMARATAEAKPASEGERKALSFYERMRDAEQSMNTLEDNLSKMSATERIRLKNAPDWLQSETGQLYWQALRQFTEARLRKESGAVIAQSEFDYSEKTFFDQPLDTPATKARKKAARELIIGSMRREAGRAYTQTYSEGEPAAPTNTAPTAPAGVPKVGDTLPNGERIKKVTKVQ